MPPPEGEGQSVTHVSAGIPCYLCLRKDKKKRAIHHLKPSRRKNKPPLRYPPESTRPEERRIQEVRRCARGERELDASRTPVTFRRFINIRLRSTVTLVEWTAR